MELAHADGWPDGTHIRLLTSMPDRQEKGLPVWAWHGPRVPEYIIAHGVGEAAYEEYRRQHRKR